MFGIPMVGSDICGFFAETTEELCNRWIELGAFYPFSRNHANFDSPQQELYLWDTVANSARNALGMRYKLLPYLYTLNYEAHTTGAPIARPLFFSFPEYTDSYGLSTQFLLGTGLMISPVLQQGATNVTALFPQGSWYNLFDTTEAILIKSGKYLTLDAPLNVINIHLYQNNIVPMQQGGLTSNEARMTPYHLVVSFPAGDINGEAKGNLFIDDDELPEMKLANGSSTYVELSAALNDNMVKVWSNVQEGDFALNKGWIIGEVSVLGLSVGTVGRISVEVNGKEVKGDVGVEIKEQHYHQESDADESLKTVVVHFSRLTLPVGKNFALTWKMGL